MYAAYFPGSRNSRSSPIKKNNPRNSRTGRGNGGSSGNRADFDLFISYSHRDKQWVREWFLPRLEDEGLRVCIDFRNFELGRPILTSIEEGINRSRRSLVILTPDWVQSQWADLEALMMQSDDPANQKGRLLPVLLQACEIPRRLAILNCLDLTEASTREAQIAEFVAFLKNERASFAADAAPTKAGGDRMPNEPTNPFVWRAAITTEKDFFNRVNEQRKLKLFLGAGQNCQIVGARRIGKSSLLRRVQRQAPIWADETETGNQVSVAYLDLQDPRCHSLSGLMGQITTQLGNGGEKGPPLTLHRFMENMEDLLNAQISPVLLLDEFQELTARPQEFPHEFFLTLRACGQRGVSIFTASREPLSELVDQSDKVVSQFYNIFPLLRLEAFGRDESQAFLALPRKGVPAFSPAQIKAMVDFGRGQPLALQVAAFYATEAFHDGDRDPYLTDSLRRADDEMRSLMKARW